MSMAGNYRSKIKKKERNPRLLAGDDSLPPSRSGWGHPILPAVIHSFPTNLVQLSVDRLNSFPGCLSVGENPGNEVAFLDVDGLLKLQRFFSSWMTQSCHGLLETLEWHSTTHSLTHSLTHPLTHSFTRFLLIYSSKSNYTLYSYLPYLALLLFKVPFTHMFGIFQRVLVRRTFFPDTKEQPAEDGFCINGNILMKTENIICKKWTWNC